VDVQTASVVCFFVPSGSTTIAMSWTDSPTASVVGRPLMATAVTAGRGAVGGVGATGVCPGVLSHPLDVRTAHSNNNTARA
jgi:hypothetical protein